MNTRTSTHTTLIFCICLIASIVVLLTLARPVDALSPDDALWLEAHEAYSNKNHQKLNQLKRQMSSGYLLRHYPDYWQALIQLQSYDGSAAQAYLQQGHYGITSEHIRQNWLKVLGRKQNWAHFQKEWTQLPAQARDDELMCYHEQLTLHQGQPLTNLNRFLAQHQPSEGCTQLIAAAAQKGLLNQDWLWKRLRLLLAENSLTAAKNLVQKTKLPITLTGQPKAKLTSENHPATQELFLYAVLRQASKDLNGAASRLQSNSAALSPDRTAFGWGQLALRAARQHKAESALRWFNLTNPDHLTEDQWAWRARAALRLENWNALNQIINQMPSAVKQQDRWRYWQGRALQSLGQTQQARNHFLEARHGDHYYALLAQEALGQTLSTPVDVQKPEITSLTVIQRDPSVQRALALFKIAPQQSTVRRLAQQEWRFAMRNRSDQELLAAAFFGQEAHFYEMAIYSANQTQQQHNYALRYLHPFLALTRHHAKQHNVNKAWAYGLIRQESRFMANVRSHAGASGLMQLMPATARWVANKANIHYTNINDPNTNLQLGTWYLRHVYERLSNNAVLATAAYNAGPGRAKTWQATRHLDGEIYIETIPFNETRGYVQSVLANRVHYAHLFWQKPVSLQAFLGSVPAK